MKPNPIDFGTVWVAFADIHNNIAVLATIIAIFLLYLIVIVWARGADLRDRNSQVVITEFNQNHMTSLSDRLPSFLFWKSYEVPCSFLCKTNIFNLKVPPQRFFFAWR